MSENSAAAGHREAPFPDGSRLDALSDGILAAVPAASRLAAGLPPADFVAPFVAADPFRGYRHVPPSVAARCASLEEAGGSAALPAYLALVLVHLMRSAGERVEAAGLPRALHAQVARQMRRICDDLAAGDFARFSLDDDIWLKDFGICRLSLLPCVTHLLWRHSGVPRRVLVRQRPLAMMRALSALARCGGARPFLEGHTHLRMLEDFDEDGRRRCLGLVAELLRAWPDSRGLIGSSWYYDPEVGVLSPRLRYLRELAEDGGAVFLDNGGGSAAHGALSRSPTRRRLYREGRYRPRNYLMIWPRAEILARWG